jgi:hypothetical protein
MVQLCDRGIKMKKCVIMLVLALLMFAVPASSQPILDTFYITVGPGGNIIAGGGTGFGNGEWYVYPSRWINEWFYDHQFDPLKGKEYTIEFDWVSLEPGLPTHIEVAFNWSTPEWSQLGFSRPPTEPAEELYILRHSFMLKDGYFPTVQHFVYTYYVWPYNPEWISIDVRGSNFAVTNGMLLHECMIGTEESSWGSIKADFK